MTRQAHKNRENETESSVAREIQFGYSTKRSLVPLYVNCYVSKIRRTIQLPLAFQFVQILR